MVPSLAQKQLDGKMPGEKELCQLAEKWKPYRSIASWYMWRALEQIKVKY